MNFVSARKYYNTVIYDVIIEIPFFGHYIIAIIVRGAAYIYICIIYNLSIIIIYMLRLRRGLTHVMNITKDRIYVYVQIVEYTLKKVKTNAIKKTKKSKIKF